MSKICPDCLDPYPECEVCGNGIDLCSELYVRDSTGYEIGPLCRECYAKMSGGVK